VAAMTPESVRALYLGCELSITERDVTVTTPDGRLVGRVAGLAAARRLVKAYRRGPIGRRNG
jgi:hypothetical protein